MSESHSDWHTSLLRDAMRRFETHILEETAADLARVRMSFHRKLGLISEGSVEQRAIAEQLTRVAHIESVLDALQSTSHRLFHAQLSDPRAPRTLEVVGLLNRQLTAAATKDGTSEASASKGVKSRKA